MDVKKIVATAAILIAAGSTHAQQTEFIAPDAGFESAMTRAEIRMGQNEAYASGVAAQGKHDGQDTLYVAGAQNRRDVRAETIKSASTHHAGDVRDIYFGE